MKYAYQRRGSGILDWNRAPPSQTRAADAKALGSLGGDTLGALELPRAGAPEPLGVVLQSDGGFRHPGMGCSSCMGDTQVRGQYVQAVGETTPNSIGAMVTKPVVLVGAAAAVYFLFIRKKKR